MAQSVSKSLTEREAQIMGALWDLGRATAEEVRKALPDSPHDSTVRTLLRVLEQKGYVTHDVQGKVYLYRPLIERANAQRSELRSVLTRFFGGSAEDLVLRLIEDEQITPEQLESLRALRSNAPNPSKPRPRRRQGGSS